MVYSSNTTPPSNENTLIQRIDRLNQIGISLSREKRPGHLLDHILVGAKEITHADGGTLYLVDQTRKELHFTIMRNDTLDVAKGGSTEEDINLPPLSLLMHGDIPNTSSVATCVAVSGVAVNVPDAYALAAGFDFLGLKKFDTDNNYKTVSILTIPMKNHENEIIGVLQLINAKDPQTGDVVAFSETDEHLAESLASQAAVALTNNQLIQSLRHLIERFIEIIANTIDEKSPYTGGHCRRVPEIAMMLADAVNQTDQGPFAKAELSADELYELKIAALLHDCGKITTPIHIVDKATKLETIFDRIEMIDHRFEILRRDLEIACLQNKIDQANYQQQLLELTAEQDFLHGCNKGSEFMAPELQQRVLNIAARTWTDSKGQKQTLLSENEAANLNIAKGTLNEQERSLINNHIVTTQRMLEGLPFPRYLKNVAEIAGNHHERMDGKGYPNGLTREQMSVRARIMGIADIFEALTAADRPYKPAMPLSLALKIMSNMKEEGHIDPDLYDVFVQQNVHMSYGETFLRPEQIDIKAPKTSQRKKSA